MFRVVARYVTYMKDDVAICFVELAMHCCQKNINKYTIRVTTDKSTAYTFPKDAATRLKVLDTIGNYSK